MNTERITDLVSKAYHGDIGAQTKVTRELVDMSHFHKNLYLDVKVLENAIHQGLLDIRVDPAKYSGEYKQIVESMNATLDAISGPLKMSIEYTDQLSRGILPSKITDTCYGDMDRIKNNLNNCIDTFNSLKKETSSSGKDIVNDKKSSETLNEHSNFSHPIDDTAQLQKAHASTGTNGKMPHQILEKIEQTRGVISWGDREYNIDEFRALLLKKPVDTVGAIHHAT